MLRGVLWKYKSNLIQLGGTFLFHPTTECNGRNTHQMQSNLLLQSQIALRAWKSLGLLFIINQNYNSHGRQYYYDR